MPTIWFYFDFACAHAYIALHQLPHVLQGLSWQVRYCPIACAAAPKDADLTQAQQLAHTMQLPLLPPAVFPFDSTAWLHMALAAAPHGQPSRYICTALLHAIWQHGHNPQDANVQQQAWQDATALLPHTSDRHNPRVKTILAANHALATQHHINITPSFVLQATPNTPAHILYGLDALPKLRAAVQACQT